VDLFYPLSVHNLITSLGICGEDRDVCDWSVLVSRILPRQEVSDEDRGKVFVYVLQDEHGVILKVVHHGDLQAGDHDGHIHIKRRLQRRKKPSASLSPSTINTFRLRLRSLL
jgi:hypothetical protein